MSAERRRRDENGKKIRKKIRKMAVGNGVGEEGGENIRKRGMGHETGTGNEERIPEMASMYKIGVEDGGKNCRKSCGEEAVRGAVVSKLLRTSVILAGGFLIFLASAAVTGAFLTDSSEELLNRMIPGQVAVELTEPDWDPEEEVHMLPGTAEQKNPTAVNTGTMESWIFMEVEIPTATISLVDSETGRKQERKKTELFTYTAADSWELISGEETETAVRYVYGYQETVSPGEETDPLFSEITMVNYLEGELDSDQDLSIPAQAQSIQSSVCAEGTSLKEIYQIYLDSVSREEAT